MKASIPIFTSTQRLGQRRERIRHLQYSLQTEKAYLYWVRLFSGWHGNAGFTAFACNAQGTSREAATPARQ
jgi:hypothetical protein